MHSRKIIFRDLKLENCLLTSKGMMKLTDLGLAKVVIGKTYTVCGTVDYFAPETLRQTGHNRAVDWWALGVLIFIMMTGHSPFDAPDVMQTYKMIFKGFAKVVFPDDMSDDCVSLVRALCQKKPEERLTMGKRGVKNLQEHLWYSDFDWRSLEKQTLEPPWQPDIDEEKLIAKISKKNLKFTNQKYKYEDDGSDWDACFDMNPSYENNTASPRPNDPQSRSKAKIAQSGTLAKLDEIMETEETGEELEEEEA
jgi:serine/threonine protein kinase